jgi:hypothetical protein
MVNPFKKFTLANVSKKLNEINFKISLSHKKPFPNLSLLSQYQFKKHFVKIFSNGGISPRRRLYEPEARVDIAK